jgi:hypothetical protein
VKVWLKRIALALLALLAVSGTVFWVLVRSWRRDFEAEVQALENAGSTSNPFSFEPPPIPKEQNAALLIEEACRLVQQLPDEDGIDWTGLTEGRWYEAAGVDRFLVDRKEVSDKLQQALLLPRVRFTVDYSKGYGILNPVLGEILKCKRVFVSRAVRAMKAGTTAAPDLLAYLELIRRLREDPPLITQLIRCVMLQEVVELLRHPDLKLTSAEWKVLSEAFEKDSFGPAFIRGFELERAMTVHLSRTYFLRGLQPPDVEQFPSMFWTGAFAPRVLADYLRTMGRILDLSRKPFWEVHAEQRALESELTGDVRWGRIFSHLLGPVFLKTRTNMTQADAWREMGAAFCRLKSFAITPETTDGLDLFSGKPLLYRKTAKDFELWSVGPNLQDDEGREDDLVLKSRN